MPEAKATVGLKSASMSVRVIRADGTVEDLGEVAYYHRNPLRRLWWRLRHKSLKEA